MGGARRVLPGGGRRRARARRAATATRSGPGFRIAHWPCWPGSRSRGRSAIGIAGLFVVSWTLLPFVVAGAFVVLAYNLELFGGRFHTDFWFAAAWGAFPALTGFWANALGIHSARRGGRRVPASTAACFGLSVAQRRLSTPVRELRRQHGLGERRAALADGTERELTPRALTAPLDGALKALSASVVLLAVALVAIRL